MAQTGGNKRRRPRKKPNKPRSSKNADAVIMATAVKCVAVLENYTERDLKKFQCAQFAVDAEVEYDLPEFYLDSKLEEIWDAPYTRLRSTTRFSCGTTDLVLFKSKRRHSWSGAVRRRGSSPVPLVVVVEEDRGALLFEVSCVVDENKGSSEDQPHGDVPVVGTTGEVGAVCAGGSDVDKDGVGSEDQSHGSQPDGDGCVVSGDGDSEGHEKEKKWACCLLNASTTKRFSFRYNSSIGVVIDKFHISHKFRRKGYGLLVMAACMGITSAFFDMQPPIFIPCATSQGKRFYKKIGFTAKYPRSNGDLMFVPEEEEEEEEEAAANGSAAAGERLDAEECSSDDEATFTALLSQEELSKEVLSQQVFDFLNTTQEWQGDFERAALFEPVDIERLANEVAKTLRAGYNRAALTKVVEEVLFPRGGICGRHLRSGFGLQLGEQTQSGEEGASSSSSSSSSSSGGGGGGSSSNYEGQSQRRGILSGGGVEAQAIRTSLARLRLPFQSQRDKGDGGLEVRCACLKSRQKPPDLPCIFEPD